MIFIKDTIMTYNARETQLILKVKTAIAVAQNRPNTRILFVVNRTDQVISLFAKENLKPPTKDGNEIYFSNGSCITIRDYACLAKIKTQYNEIVVDECLDQHTKNLAKSRLLLNKGLCNGERT